MWHYNNYMQLLFEKLDFLTKVDYKDLIMKKFFSIIFLCLVTFSLVLTGCTETGLDNNPATNARVVSNGGMTVVKGDYLYYVNGYVDETTLIAEDNAYGSVSHGAIYRTKLSDGTIEKDDDGFLNNTECVVPKIVGFSNGGFYIIDDYIYYATPYMKLNSQTGVLQSNRVEFHRIKIDGTQDKVLYATDVNEDNLDWTFVKVGNTVYLVTYVDQKIISVNTESTAVIASVENSTSYTILKETDLYSAATSAELKSHVYFTRAITAEDNAPGTAVGNVVCKVNITTGQVSRLEISTDFTYSFKKALDSDLYYTKTNTKIGGIELPFKKSMTDAWVNVGEQKLADTNYTNYYYCTIGNNLIIATDSTSTWLIEGGVSKQIATSAYSIVGVFGNYAYFIKDSHLFRFNLRGEVSNNQIATQQVSNNEKTHNISDARFVDFDNRRVYVYAEYTSNRNITSNYLNYIDETTLKQRFVGNFETYHLPPIPEQINGYGKVEDIPYTPHID